MSRERSRLDVCPGVRGSDCSTSALEPSLSRVIGLSGSRPVALHPLQILCTVNALLRALIYILVYSTFDIRLESSLATLLVC